MHLYEVRRTYNLIKRERARRKQVLADEEAKQREMWAKRFPKRLKVSKGWWIEEG